MYEDNTMKLNKITMALAMLGMPLAASAANLPTGGEFIKNTSGTIVTDTNTVAIVGSNDNNVIRWDSFDIAKGYSAFFDGKNYLNLVKGSSASNIAGGLYASGNVFIVNPNGINVTNSATVKVMGTLGLSTAKLDDDALDRFTLSGVVDNTGMGLGKIRLLGTVKANNLYLDGSQIIIRDATQIMDTSDSGTMLSNENGTQVSISSSTNRIDIGSSEKLDYEAVYGLTEADGVVDHYGQTAISDAEEFAAMDSDGNYWLTSDIDLETIYSPVLETFSGTLDGSFNTLTYRLYIDDDTAGSYGLFSQLDGATVENLKIDGATLYVNSVGEGSTLGALAGTVSESTLSNIEVSDLAVSGTGTGFVLGGVAAEVSDSTLSNITSTIGEASEQSLTSSGTDYATVFYTAYSSNVTDGIIAGDSTQGAPAVATNLGGYTFYDSFAQAVSEHSGTENFSSYFITDQAGEDLAQKGFLKPYFVTNLETVYDGTAHSYESLLNDSVFDYSDYIQTGQTDGYVNAGSYNVGLSSSSGFYFVNSDGSESIDGNAYVNIAKRELGEIEVGDYSMEDGVLPELGITNEESLNFAQGDTFSDLGLTFTVDGDTSVSGTYSLGLTGESANYTYSVKEGTLTVTAPRAETAAVTTVGAQIAQAVGGDSRTGVSFDQESSCSFCRGTDLVEVKRAPSLLNIESMGGVFSVANSTFEEDEGLLV